MTALEKNKDGIPHLYKFYISLFLRSKKSMIWHFQKTLTKRKTDIKKHITSANERDKAHFKRV